MKKSSLDDVKCVVVRSLQARLVVSTASGIPTERSPGSRVSDGIERAIDYTLSSRRAQQEPVFLQHDVLRNARLAVRRSAEAEVRALAEIAIVCAPAHVDLRSWPVHRGGRAGKIAGTALISAITPEDVATTGDFERRLQAAVRSAFGVFTAQVLQCMIGGDTVRETAYRLGASTRTVDRARAKIRTLASALLEQALAA